jgi:hypothetical protein
VRGKLEDAEKAWREGLGLQVLSDDVFYGTMPGDPERPYINGSGGYQP